MKKNVSLKNLEDGFEIPDEWYAGFDQETGKVVTVDDGTMRIASDAEDQGLKLEEVDTDSEIIADMLPLAWDIVIDHENKRFIELPSKWDFHEYRRMEEFIEALPVSRAKERLWRAISRKGAFRRFKDEAHRLDLIDAWYDFRQTALRRMLRDWALRHELVVVED